MQQRSAKSFQQLYKQICQMCNVSINQGLKSGISDCHIELLLEQIQQNDLEPLSMLLTQGRFKSITLRSMQKNLKLNKSAVHDSFKGEILDILKVITKLFTRSLDVLSFTVRDIRLNSEHMQVLAQGISIVQSLKELRIIQCLITSQHFAIIQPALIQNSSLVHLDLSHNYLTSSIGYQIIQLLQEHSLRRDRIEYVYRTREEDPEEDISLIGICDLNLSYNKLNDLFIKELVPYLEKDRWVKKIQIKYNQIQKEGLELLIGMLDKNITLQNLDVRHNIGITQQLQKEILQKLLRNKTIGKENLNQKQIEDGEENILVNVSAIPTNLQTQLSYDQESPVMSFGVFDTKDQKQQQQQQQQLQNSVNFSKTEAIKFKSGIKESTSGCQECTKLQEKIKKQQQIISMLIQENNKLKNQLKGPHSQQNNILKFLENPNSQQQPIEEEEEQEQDQQQDDMMDNIELMMNELTRMMDSIDNQGSATNNITAHLSSTMLGQNNITRVIFERDDRNNEQLMNILEQTSPNQSQSQ